MTPYREARWTFGSLRRGLPGKLFAVIVGLLLVAALLMDRFVLLPEFDGGDGSAGVAVAAWLGVNLLPALAWLALNARNEERTTGQLMAGTLAIITTTAVLIVPIQIWWTATGESDGGSSGATNTAFSPPSAETVDVRCEGPASQASDGSRSAAFVVADGEDPVSLLMEGTSFRPGDSFLVAVRNETDEAVSYGVKTSIEDPATGEPIPLGSPMNYILPLFLARPGDAGPCTSVRIPSAIDPGTYRAVLGISRRGADEEEDQLVGEFEVGGAPVSNGWEQDLADAKRKVRQIERDARREVRKLSPQELEDAKRKFRRIVKR